MIIDYLGHSGFLFETDRELLLFDYYRGDLSLLRQKPKEKPLFVFVSHVHGDHYNPNIFTLADGYRSVTFLLSFDLKGDHCIPSNHEIIYVDEDQTYAVEDLGTVQTLRSTDEGVAFLVATSKEVIFHAGDLHWWDWPGEDPEWLKEQEIVFQREIQKIEKTTIDVACVVLDDRLEENYARGMEYFLQKCHPRYVIPMHFWKDQSVVDRFNLRPGEWKTDTILLNTAKDNHWKI